MRAVMSRAHNRSMRSCDRESLSRRPSMSDRHHVSEWTDVRLRRLPVRTVVSGGNHSRVRHTDRESMPGRSCMRAWLDVRRRPDMQCGHMLHSKLSGDARVRRNDEQRLRRNLSRHNVRVRLRMQHNFRNVRVRSLLSADGDVRRLQWLRWRMHG